MLSAGVVCCTHLTTFLVIASIRANVGAAQFGSTMFVAEAPKTFHSMQKADDFAVVGALRAKDVLTCIYQSTWLESLEKALQS